MVLRFAFMFLCLLVPDLYVKEKGKKKKVKPYILEASINKQGVLKKQDSLRFVYVQRHLFILLIFKTMRSF